MAFHNGFGPVDLKTQNVDELSGILMNASYKAVYDQISGRLPKRHQKAPHPPYEKNAGADEMITIDKNAPLNLHFIENPRLMQAG